MDKLGNLKNNTIFIVRGDKTKTLYRVEWDLQGPRDLTGNYKVFNCWNLSTGKREMLPLETDVELVARSRDEFEGLSTGALKRKK